MQQCASVTLQHDSDRQNTTPAVGVDVDTTLINPTAAQRLQSVIQSGRIQHVNKPARRRVVVGKMSVKDDKLRPVTTYRNINLFVSRVNPQYAESMITECVQDALKMCSPEKCQDAKIVCEKLVTKYDFYSSYRVTITVDSVIFRESIEGLMSNEVWPSGLLVRRFFIKKNNGSDGQ